MKVSAQIKRKYRLKKAIKNILENNLNESYFLTLTFNDEILTKTTKEKRLNLIKTFLNNQTDKYILNCDYGKKNGREHYHALVIAKDKFINYVKYSKLYGNIKVLPMNLYKNQSINSKTEYLLNHALKDTSERKIIYSKSKRANHKIKDTKHYFIANNQAQNKYIERLQAEQQENEKLLKEQQEKQLHKYIINLLS